MLSFARHALSARATLSRRIHIATETTPNPNSLKFSIQGRLMEQGTRYFKTKKDASASPLAEMIFGNEGVSSVMFGTDFITVNKSTIADWDALTEKIKTSINCFYESDLPVINREKENQLREDQLKAAKHQEEDSEVVAMIKNILDTRIRPNVQEDGGDLEFKGFEDGVVYIALQGACGSCPSSSVTLKLGVENMLKYYIAEVERVEEVIEEHEVISDEQFARLERALANKKL